MPATRAPDHILTDLARKAADDVSAAIRRTAALVNDPRDLLYIALAGTAAASGLASGFAQMCAPDADPEESVDALWAVLRPMIVLVAGGGSADFRELLRVAPKAGGVGA